MRICCACVCVYGSMITPPMCFRGCCLCKRQYIRRAICALLHACESAVAVGGGSTADVSSRRQPQHLSYYPSCLRLGLCKPFYYITVVHPYASAPQLSKQYQMSAGRGALSFWHFLFGTKKSLLRGVLCSSTNIASELNLTALRTKPLQLC